MTFSGGYSWDAKDTALGGARQKSDQLWLNADVRLSEKTELSASYSRTDGTGRPSYNWIRADLKHDLGRGRKLQIRIQRRGGALGRELAVGLELVFPLSVPVPWLPKSGKLEGRVYANEGRGEPLEGVVVLVDGMKVATNGSGYFEFPSLPAGEYELRIDRGTLGLAQIPDTATPLVFSIKAGETVELDIPIVVGATISGKVTAALYTNGNGNSRHNGFNNDIVISSIPLKSLGNGNHGGNGYSNGNGTNGEYAIVGVSGVIIVLENNEEQFVRVSDLNGEFYFSELRPGRWRLSLAEGQLPKYFELVPSEFEMNLLQGQTSDTIEFMISPVARSVIITASNGDQIVQQ